MQGYACTQDCPDAPLMVHVEQVEHSFVPCRHAGSPAVIEAFTGKTPLIVHLTFHNDRHHKSVQVDASKTTPSTVL
jgi:hypothetical protein